MKPSRVRRWLGPALLAAAAVVVVAAWMDRPGPAQDMAAAATRFLQVLTPEQRAKAALAFDSKAREDWHYVPRQTAGVEFAQMSEPQRAAARELMHSALSARGMGKVEEIMLLESVLRDMEKGAGARRDPLAYSVAVFGTPGSGPWGWKLEGHHVSLNFTGAGDQTTTTPSFLGANPAEIKEGPRAGARVLAAEEDLARQLLATFTPEQRKQAVIADRAPADILAVPGRSLGEIDAAGLPVSLMSAAQRATVEQLLAEYAGTLRHELADHELEHIRAAGLEKVRFAWMGSAQRGQGHYYRLSGPTFVIEYDNTQNDANHIHTVWRDRERDFGHDLLKEHFEHAHGAAAATDSSAARPLKVFILAGQSNMEGQAVVDLTGKDYNDGKGTLVALMSNAPKPERFKHLKDERGNWSVRDDVWVRYQPEGAPLLAGPLALGFTPYRDQHHFGPELQFGHVLGDALDNEVLLIKTAWGGKSLFVDFRPPSSGGNTGTYYTLMIQQVRDALANFKREFPASKASGYELAGFVWYHGWNDGCDPAHAVPEYERNLVNLIKDVRRDLNAPALPVVVGEITGPWVNAPGEWDQLRKAQAAAAMHPEFAGSVVFVPTHDYVRRPEESPNPRHGHHEFGNAETYYLVGDALGSAMTKLLAHSAGGQK